MILVQCQCESAKKCEQNNNRHHFNKRCKGLHLVINSCRPGSVRQFFVSSWPVQEYGTEEAAAVLLEANAVMLVL
eukprot:3085377-Amphidinium_carterae.1